jgi:hypothetical protein
MIASQSAFSNNMQALPQHRSTAFPPGFQQPPNPLLLTPPQQQMMSQLDRQMVLNSYAGVNNPPTTSSHPQFNQHSSINNPMLDPTSGGMGEFDFHGLSHPNGSNGNIDVNPSLWGDPSTAWFMPFNVDPPAIGEDGNWFAGNFDWGGFGGGFGGLDGGLPPTGLTPRPEMEGGGGQEGGLEGMGDM